MPRKWAAAPGEWRRLRWARDKRSSGSAAAHDWLAPLSLPPVPGV